MFLNSKYTFKEVIDWADTYCMNGSRMFARKGDMVIELYRNDFSYWQVIWIGGNDGI